MRAVLLVLLFMLTNCSVDSYVVTFDNGTTSTIREYGLCTLNYGTVSCWKTEEVEGLPDLTIDGVRDMYKGW